MKRVFIVGCPRSGSTWATFILAQHAAVATVQHAKVFHYLVRMQEWHHKRAGGSFILDPLADRGALVKDKNLRLAEVLTEEDLFLLLRDVAAGVLNRVAGLRPGVSVVVDKTPENGHLGEFILNLFPDAYMLHIVRDPRSVFCSHRSASASWAKREFPRRPVDGARFWKNAVEAARRIEDRTERYLQIRYEDLKESGPTTAKEIFCWLGLEASPGFCEKAIAASSKDKVRETNELPQDFVRKTTPRGWRDELSHGDVKIIEHVASDLMCALDYERSMAPSRFRPPRVIMHDVTDPVLTFVDKKLHVLTQRTLWRWIGRRLEWPSP